MNNTCTTCNQNNGMLPFEYLTTPLEMLERGGQMIKRADGSYSRRGLWDNIRANAGSGKTPTKQMLEQERKLKSKQYGGQDDEQEQLVQIIKAYAQLHNVEPQVIIQQLQELEENEQQQALQSMLSELQQGSAQNSAPMFYANNNESAEMESYEEGGVYNDYYRTSGGYGVQGAAGLGEGIPYIAPAVHTAIGDSKMFGPLKALTGYMGLASGFAGSALGYGKSAQWLGNKIKPNSNIMQNTNNTLKNVVDFGVNAGYATPYYNNTKENNNVSPINYEAVNSADFTKMPVYNDNPKYKNTMVGRYGGTLPKHQGNIPGVPSTVQSAGMMRDDGSTDYNEGYYQAYSQNNNAYNIDYDKQYMNMSLEDEQLKKQKNQGSQPNPGFQNNSNFYGNEYAQKAMTGLGTFNNYLDWKENNRRQREYENMLKRVGNTDFRLASNSPNPYGNYTLNVGPSNNFQLGMTTPIQDFGTSAKYGGSFKNGGQLYAEGGEYQVSEDELLQLMQDGAEIEFIN